MADNTDLTAIKNFPGAQPHMRWYVISCYFLLQDDIIKILKKDIAKENLSHLIGDIRQFTKRNYDPQVKKAENLFPGYIFIYAQLNSYLINLILKIRGVRRFLGNNDRPIPLSFREVKSFIERINTTTHDTNKTEVQFAVGDYVRITGTNLQNKECQVIKMNYVTQIATVNVEWFGRMTPTDIDFKYCQKIF